MSGRFYVACYKVKSFSPKQWTTHPANPTEEHEEIHPLEMFFRVMPAASTWGSAIDDLIRKQAYFMDFEGNGVRYARLFAQ